MIENSQSNNNLENLDNSKVTKEETPQKISTNIGIYNKKDINTDCYLDININLESMTRSEFNLLEIKKELTDIKEKEILSQYVKPFDSIEEEISEDKKQKDVEKTIKQWLSLQKTIKEEITLEDVIIHQQTSDTEKLKEFFKSYYDLKLKKRKNFEDINELNMGNKDYLDLPSFYIQEEVEKNLKDACEPIKNLLFIFRDNYDYLIRLLSLIKESDFSENRKKINSIVELFNNQFYENILIPNPEQQELLILIYKLFEEEIISMGAACSDDFLNNNSFLGIFLSSYSKRQENIGYISNILNPIIFRIDNDERECIDMSITSIKRDIDKSEKENKEKKNNYNSNKLEKIDYSKGPRAIKEFLLGKIPKTKIKFKKYIELEAEKEKEDDIKPYISKDDNEVNEYDKNMANYNNKRLRRTLTEKSTFNFGKENEYDKEYLFDINQEKLFKKLKEEKDNDLKEFYIKQIELINNDSKIFTNEGILKILDAEKKEIVIQNYKNNFLFIREIIESLLQTIFDKIITLPYPLRCISKIIYILISKKFPFLSTYSINSFIGKFILNKCIFPVLKLENKDVMDSRIFSTKTKKCLDIIINILAKANSGTLYNTYTDPEKTIFNQFLLEIIPILNKFYEKIIDVQLPKVIDDLVNETGKKMEDNFCKKIFNFRHKKRIEKIDERNTPKPPQDYNQMPPPLFNYFEENYDEILHLQSICFNAQDILFLIELIGRNVDKFKDLPKFNFFMKTYNRIKNESELLKNLINEQKSVTEKQNKIPFFVIFKEEQNYQLEKLKNQQKKNISTFESSEQDSDLINKRIKFCIKTILKGLNLLNNKDFGYLNFANSTDKFFSALKYTLDELGEYSELSNNIPLKWYAQYIYNYKKELENYYQKNDFAKLYEEIYTEETNILNELKSLSSIVITRDGMNLRCAEKIMEKTQYELKIIEEAKKYIQIEKFIDSEKIEVCLMPNIDKQNSNKDELVLITEMKNCNIQHFKNPNNKTNKNYSHIYYIKDFISSFSKRLFGKDKHNTLKMSSLLKKDIERGEITNNIGKIIERYLDFIKKQIKEPSNKKLFGEIKEDEIKEILGKIQNHILRHTYKKVFPKKLNEKDIQFYENTQKLVWIKPEHLEFKKLYANQLKFAEKNIQKMINAHSAYDKLECIKNAYVTMNNTVKFISGKKQDAGQDELTPLFQYILIKAKPKNLITNINYIKCFLNESELIGSRGFYVSQMESASSFIININHADLKMSKEEFDSKIKMSWEKYLKEKKNKKEKEKEKIEEKNK